MNCPACQKTPDDYLAQKEWFHKGEQRLMYTTDLLLDFRAENPLYEFCEVCNEGTQSPLQCMSALEQLNNITIDIPIPQIEDPAMTKKIKALQRTSNPKKKKQKRNALCSCNSGKKYKKCCLKTLHESYGEDPATNR